MYIHGAVLSFQYEEKGCIRSTAEGGSRFEETDQAYPPVEHLIYGYKIVGNPWMEGKDVGAKKSVLKPVSGKWEKTVSREHEIE